MFDNFTEARPPSRLTYHSSVEIAAPEMSSHERDTVVSELTSLVTAMVPCVNDDADVCSLNASISSGESLILSLFSSFGFSTVSNEAIGTYFLDLLRPEPTCECE